MTLGKSGVALPVPRKRASLYECELELVGNRILEGTPGRS